MIAYNKCITDPFDRSIGFNRKVIHSSEFGQILHGKGGRGGCTMNNDDKTRDHGDGGWGEGSVKLNIYSYKIKLRKKSVPF